MASVQKLTKIVLAPLSENKAYSSPNSPPNSPSKLSILSKRRRKSVFRRIDTLENFGYSEPMERYSTFSPDIIKHRNDISRKGNVMSVADLWGPRETK